MRLFSFKNSKEADCLSTHRHRPVYTHPPTLHLGLLTFRLWLHQKVQGPCQELGREPGSLDLGPEGGAGRLILI